MIGIWVNDVNSEKFVKLPPMLKNVGITRD